MSLALVLALGAVGGLGAIARFVLDGAVSAVTGAEFPVGTLAVNLVGAFGLGIAVGVSLGRDSYWLVGTGFIGAFTTFSTWTFESHRLGEDGQLRLAGLNLVLSLLLGLAAAWAGRLLGGVL